ncbi:MAG: RNA polymerase sigma factor [Muricauda sp.]|uniref:RNA polymerase subunit sigma24 n=1 Tax=Flagellimonas lutaonensis TaxID=516051 RepID=A0A0D5YTH3_9FLAO|nr:MULTISPECIES: RNA polymerase sigma factor [Allomuricauda]AKA35199.1 RNA polymerase subunit sigma24 [Allomuricauda lutaonensis]MBC29491.1 RNA polymerase sigma factor [Allomuricauda sp.]
MTTDQENHKKLTDFFADEYQSLKGYVQSKINSTVESDAEDVVQEVALKLFSRTNASPIDNIAGFVYQSIRNKIIDLMRTKKERLYDEKALEQVWTDFAELFYGTSETEYPEHLTEHLKQAVMSLKPVYRDIILAVDFEGYTYREIAEETGIPQGTLMSRRHRALSLLLKNLENETTI